MKEYLKTLGIALGILLFMYILFAVSGLTLGDNSHDFGKQHVKFIEYIRNLIFATRDLSPQITMNYGLGQSFVTLYYHGLYNPYVMFSLLLGPYVSIKIVMYFIYLMIIGLTSLSMHWLARVNKFTHYQARVISLLTTFSGVVVFHLSWHPMFIYYFPFMILSLVSIHYMVLKKNIYFYSLMLGMVFYTNFFFAPIVSIIQFLYLIGLIIDTNEKILPNLWNFIKAYVLGVLMGALFLIPVYLFASEGVRSANPILSDSLFNNFSDTMFNILNYKYVAGIGIVPIFATIYGLTCLKEKRLLLPILFLAITFIFNKVILLLNLNMYHEFKYFINFIPLLWLVMGKYLFNERIKIKKLIVPVICIVLVLLAKPSDIDLNRKIILVIEAVIFALFTFNRNNYQLTAIITMLIVLVSFATNIIVVTSDSYLQSTLNQTLKQKKPDLSKDVNIKPYRVGAYDINSLESLTTLSPNIYTSLENASFEQMINKYLEVEIADPSRYHRDTVFDNYLMRNYLGIKTQKDEKGKFKSEEVNPMVYGLASKDTYDYAQLTNMDKEERLLAVNQGVFVDGANKQFKSKIEPKEVYFNSKGFTFDQKGKFKKSYSIPKEYQKEGVLRITADAAIPNGTIKREDVIINKHINMVMNNDYYGPYLNNKVTFLIDTSKDVKSLDVEVDNSENKKNPFSYSNLKVEFIDQAEIQDNKFKVFSPTKFQVDMSHAYKFTINQKEDGYLATTLPYDRGFTILVDGKISPITKINGLFLGTNLSAGTHEIEIKYEIPMYKEALVTSLVALSIIILGEIKYFIKRKRRRK